MIDALEGPCEDLAQPPSDERHQALGETEHQAELGRADQAPLTDRAADERYGEGIHRQSDGENEQREHRGALSADRRD